MSQNDPNAPQQFYSVERIVARRQTSKGPEYLVKWVNYDQSQNTWEPKRHLASCLDLVEKIDREYEAKKVEQRQREKELRMKLNQQSQERTPPPVKKSEEKSRKKRVAYKAEEDDQISPIVISSNPESKSNDPEETITRRRRSKGAKAEPVKEITPPKPKQKEKDITPPKQKEITPPNQKEITPPPKQKNTARPLKKETPDSSKMVDEKKERSHSSPKAIEESPSTNRPRGRPPKMRLEDTGFKRPFFDEKTETLASKFIQHLDEDQDKIIKVKKDPTPKPKPKLPEEIYVHKKPTAEVPVEYFDRWYFQQGYTLGTIHTHYFEGQNIIMAVNVLREKKVFCMVEIPLSDMVQIDKDATEKYLEMYLSLLTKNHESRFDHFEQFWKEVPQP